MAAVCLGILLMYCFPVSGGVTVDSFCTVYQRVVVAKGEGKIVASDAVKRRIIANELLYRQTCNGAK